MPARLSPPPPQARLNPVTPDDHSKLAPLLPIPNRTVKRLRDDDSAAPRVKVGHRQALILSPTNPPVLIPWGVFCISAAPGSSYFLHASAPWRGRAGIYCWTVSHKVLS